MIQIALWLDTSNPGGDCDNDCSRSDRINPKIMLGKPVIRGKRIRVELIVRKMAEGADEKAVLQAYPALTSKDCSCSATICRRFACA